MDREGEGISHIKVMGVIVVPFSLVPFMVFKSKITATVRVILVPFRVLKPKKM